MWNKLQIFFRFLYVAFQLEPFRYSEISGAQLIKAIRLAEKKQK
jgi:hypothetical protein